MDPEQSEMESASETNFGYNKPRPLTGTEPIGHSTVLDFWRWSASDLLSDAKRGILAEFIVARALGDASPVRRALGVCDITTPEGINVMVESAALSQSWDEKRHSQISFEIAPTAALDAATDKHHRPADVYVFALLDCQDKRRVDPLDLDRWRFFVLSGRVLDREVGEAKTIGLAELKALLPIETVHEGLPDAVRQARPPAPTADVVDPVQRQAKDHEVLRSFWSNVVITDKCWEWRGGTNNHSTPSMVVAGTHIAVIRLSWTLAFGRPPARQVRRTCGNLLCVRPDHLGGPQQPPAAARLDALASEQRRWLSAPLPIPATGLGDGSFDRQPPACAPLEATRRVPSEALACAEDLSLRVDARASDRKRQGLHRYLSESVDSGSTLVCKHAESCRQSVGSDGFAAGQLSHVGRFYELSQDGHPLRILVVPKQTGRGHEHVTVQQRGEQVETAKPFSARPMPRTPHMDGTALALHVLLGLPVEGPDTFQLDGQEAHVFDCFSMANSTLCSRIRSNAAGEGSRTMHMNCLVHVRRTVQILSPTVILAQGWTKDGTSPSSIVASVLGVEKPGRNECTFVESPNGPIAFVAASHPSRNWATTNFPGWTEVERSLRAARNTVASR